MIVKEESELCSPTGELKCSSESYDKGRKLGAGAQKAGASDQLGLETQAQVFTPTLLAKTSEVPINIGSFKGTGH